MSSRTGNGLKALLHLVYAARMTKNVPLLFLLLGGAFTTSAGPDLSLLGAATVLLLVSSAFMTHINILTDAELDRAKKPHLYRWMSTNPVVTMWVLIAEALTLVIGLFVLAFWNINVALGLLAFSLVTILYSYNLFSSNPVRWRLKAHWWGHFIACMGAYTSLWYAGHFCTEDGTLGSLVQWLPIITFISLSEYSLFLSESAVDDEEERKLKLNTFARLLGRHRSSILAVAVWLVSIVGCAAFAFVGATDFIERSFLIAFLPALLLRGGALVVLALRLDVGIDNLLRQRLPDVVFWASRIVTVGALVLLFVTTTMS